MIVTRRAERQFPTSNSFAPTKFLKRRPIKSFKDRYNGVKYPSYNFKEYGDTANVSQRKVSGSNPTKFKIRVGEASAKGCRPTMEDRSIICQKLRVENSKSLICDENNHVQLHAVLDGHGGHQCSQWMSENLIDLITDFLILEESVERALEKAFECADQMFLKKGIKSGSTCVCMLIEEATQTAWVCNLGDSRCVFSSGWQSKDHRPTESSELARIELAGGTVINNRVQGLLAVSRAFGDKAFKPIVSATPEITKHDLSKMKSQYGSHLFAILACDGLWDYLSVPLALSLASDGLMLASPEDVSWGLIRAALDEKASKDNVSVLLIQLN